MNNDYRERLQPAVNGRKYVYNIYNNNNVHHNYTRRRVEQAALPNTYYNNNILVYTQYIKWKRKKKCLEK